MRPRGVRNEWDRGLAACVLGLVPLGPHREGRLFEYRASPPIHEFEWNHTGAPPSSCPLCERLIDWSMLSLGIISQIQRRMHGLLEGNSLSLGFSQCWAWSSQQDGREDDSFPLGFSHLINHCFPSTSERQSPALSEKGSKTHRVLDYFFFFFFWSHPKACGIPVARPGVEPAASSVKAWSLKHWTVREVPLDYSSHVSGSLRHKKCSIQVTFLQTHWTPFTNQVGSLGIFARRVCKK